jgi:hypothetical protein
MNLTDAASLMGRGITGSLRAWTPPPPSSRIRMSPACVFEGSYQGEGKILIPPTVYGERRPSTRAWPLTS